MPRARATAPPPTQATSAEDPAPEDDGYFILDINDLVAPRRRYLRLFGQRLEMTNVDELSPLEYAYLNAKRERITYLVRSQPAERPPLPQDIDEVERLSLEIMRRTIIGITEDHIARMETAAGRRSMEKAALAVSFFGSPQELTRPALLARAFLIGGRSTLDSTPSTAPPPPPPATGSTSRSNGSEAGSR